MSCPNYTAPRHTRDGLRQENVTHWPELSDRRVFRNRLDVIVNERRIPAVGLNQDRSDYKQRDACAHLPTTAKRGRGDGRGVGDHGEVRFFGDSPHRGKPPDGTEKAQERVRSIKRLSFWPTDGPGDGPKRQGHSPRVFPMVIALRQTSPPLLCPVIGYEDALRYYCPAMCCGRFRRLVVLQFFGFQR